MRPAIFPLLLVLQFAALPAVAGDERAALLQQRHEKLKEKWEVQFRAADLDQSRGLSREELRDGKLPGSLLRQFEVIDENHDEALSPEELMAVYERRLNAQRRVPGRPQ